MQLARRMVWMRSRLPAPFWTTSSGGLGLSISDSPGLSRTGTFRCSATFAAAEAVMGLAAGRRRRHRRQRTRRHFAGGRNGEVFAAGRAVNLRAGTGLVHRQFLVAVGAVENDVHSWGALFRASLSLRRGTNQKKIRPPNRSCSEGWRQLNLQQFQNITHLDLRRHPMSGQ